MNDDDWLALEEWLENERVETVAAPRQRVVQAYLRPRFRATMPRFSPEVDLSPAWRYWLAGALLVLVLQLWLVMEVMR